MEYTTERDPRVLLMEIAGITEAKAKKIANAFTRGTLSRASVAELQGCGCTYRQARAIVSAFELSRNTAARDAQWGSVLRQPSDAAGYLRAQAGDLQSEQFSMLMLDARQRVMEFRTIAMGSIAQVDVHPRELFRPCVRAGAHSIILCHNHPSGDPEPSESDVELTRRMAEVGRLVGIPVVDHLVVTRDDFSSLAALNLMG